MSKDKSRIKDVWRHDELREALVWVDDRERVPFADRVGYVFEDASVRFAQGATGDGGEFVDSFARSIGAHFAEYPRAHTFVMAFDDKRHVPERKRATQSSRRDDLTRAAERAAVPEWRWDGVSPVVAFGRELPPWSRLRLDAAAYARAVSDVVELLAANVQLPPARRLIIDEGWRALVVETSLDGRTLEPLRVDERSLFRPPIGEADMQAQWYAEAVRSRTLRVPRCARVERASRGASAFYESSRTDVPVEWQHRPGAVEQAVDAFDGGAMLMVTSDTDFVVLSLAWAALVDASHANVYVALGRVATDSGGRVCTATRPDARVRREYVDIDALWRRVSALHSSPAERCTTSAWSFVAFCTACGNDYTQRAAGFSHSSMFVGYQSWLRRRTRSASLVELRRVGAVRVALLNARAFGELLEHCYHERLPTRLRPSTTLAWHQLVPLVAEQHARQEARRMPDCRRLTDYHHQVAWSLVYASTAPHGVDYVPS